MLIKRKLTIKLASKFELFNRLPWLSAPCSMFSCDEVGWEFAMLFIRASRIVVSSSAPFPHRHTVTCMNKSWSQSQTNV